MAGLALKGYNNYHSYPKYQPRTITLETEDKDDDEVFFAWHPTDGRDKPVWIQCNRQKYGRKYHGQDVSDVV